MAAEHTAQRLPIDPEAPDPELVEVAGRALREGKLVAIPTETVYGLGCNALDGAAVSGVFAAKQRPFSDPLIIHVDGAAMVAQVVDGAIGATAAVLMERFWPGPLTIVLPRGAHVPDEISGGLDTVAVRMPSHPVASAIITAAGVPVAAPSANRFSHVSPTSADHVTADLGDKIDIIVDSGRCDHGLESTVVSIVDDSVVVLRHGAVTVEELAAVVPVLTESGTVDAASSPGHDEKHYSPGRPTITVTPDLFAQAEVLADLAGDGDGGQVVYAGYDARPTGLPESWAFRSLGSRDELDRVAFGLYDALRSMDEPEVDLIVLELSMCDGLGRAIDDRLTRAGSSVVVRDQAGLLDRLGTRAVDPT